MGRMRGGMLFRYVLVCVSMGAYGVYTGCMRGVYGDWLSYYTAVGPGGEKQGPRENSFKKTVTSPIHDLRRFLTLRELSLDAERRKFPEGWKAMLCTGPPWAS